MGYEIRRIAKCRAKKKPNLYTAKCRACIDRFVCFTTGKVAIPHMNTMSEKLFEVPNTEEGLAFIELVKKHLNKDRYKIKVRGRHTNRSEVYGFSREDVLLRHANWFAVYLQPSERWKKERYGWNDD